MVGEPQGGALLRRPPLVAAHQPVREACADVLQPRLAAGLARSVEAAKARGELHLPPPPLAGTLQGGEEDPGDSAVPRTVPDGREP